MDVVQERNAGDNVITAKYVRSGNIGGLLARIEPAAGETPEKQLFYHYDGSGNVTQLTDSTQAVVAKYDYDAYGRILQSSGVEADQPYRYSTKWFHARSGLYDYGYRFYSPGMGRWINRDPIEEEGGLNVYAMVENNTVNTVDPWGLAGGDKYVQQITALRNQIAGLANDIREHIEELKRVRPPGQQLPMTAPGDDLKPSLSRAGHARRLKKEMQILANKQCKLNKLLWEQEQAIAKYAAKGAARRRGFVRPLVLLTLTIIGGGMWATWELTQYKVGRPSGPLTRAGEYMGGKVGDKFWPSN